MLYLRHECSSYCDVLPKYILLNQHHGIGSRDANCSAGIKIKTKGKLENIMINCQNVLCKH